MGPKQPTVRNVRAALRDAGVRVYEKPKAQYTHNGQLVQSTGCYGSKATKWSDTEVRVDCDIYVSSASTAAERTAKRDAAIARHVAALHQFGVTFNPTFHCLIVVTAA